MRDDRAREKAIEKLVAKKLGGGDTAPGPNCLDAATLAAYVERTLAPGERLSSEIHLAACVRCQEHVAALVRLSEADLPAGELGAARLPARRVPWFRWAWAAPVLVAVVVTGLWYTGEFDRYLRRPQEAAFKPAPTAPAHEAPAEAQPARIAEGPAARAEAHKPERRKVETADRKTLAAGGAKSTSKDIAGNAAGLAAAGAVTDQLAGAGGRIATPSERARLASAGAGIASGVGSRTGELGRSEMKTKEAPEAADKAPAAPAPAKSEAEEATRQEDARKRELAESSGERPAPRGAPAPTPTAAPKAAAKVAAAKGPMRDDELAKQRAVQGLAGGGPATERALDFRLAQVPRNWRVGRHGLIQKFDEKSGSWLTRPSGVEADLDDIAFPSRSVGWAVGQAGIILRTTDGGASWSKISSPTTEDLVRVTASSAESAQIVTRRGLKFATPDAGKTWNPLAQE